MTYALTMAILLNIMPGPAMFYVIHNSMEKNSRRTVLSLLGIELGTFMHTLAATFGLTMLLIKFPFLLIWAKYLSALFLIYLGGSALRKKSKSMSGSLSVISKDYFIVCKGIVINILNPKVILFFMAILPQCIIIDAPDAQYNTFIIGSLFCLCGVMIRGMASMAMFFSLPAQTHSPSTKILWMDKIINSLFIVFGIMLLTWPK